MKITIEFHTDNAAFEENLTLEIREVLERASSKVVWMVTTPEHYRCTSKLRDSNGNTVGTVKGERE